MLSRWAKLLPAVVEPDSGHGKDGGGSGGGGGGVDRGSNGSGDGDNWWLSFLASTPDAAKVVHRRTVHSPSGGDTLWRLDSWWQTGMWMF